MSIKTCGQMAVIGVRVDASFPLFSGMKKLQARVASERLSLAVPNTSYGETAVSHKSIWIGGAVIDLVTLAV